MLDGHRFLFTERTDSSGRSSILPYLPLILTNEKLSIEVIALLDTGARFKNAIAIIKPT